MGAQAVHAGVRRTHRRVDRVRRCHPRTAPRAADLHNGGSMSENPQASVRSARPHGTIRLTVAQALVRFLAAQYAERGGGRARFVPAASGIFGHGNAAGLGPALLQNTPDAADGEGARPFRMARNQQTMVQAAGAYAGTRTRMQTFACAASI